MQPALPDEPRRPPGAGEGDGEYAGPNLSADDVGAFSQGTPFSRWALARYLVGRAVGRSVSDTLLVVVVALVLLAVLAQLALHATWLTVILVILALGVLAVRGIVRALLSKFTDAIRYGPVEDTLRQLVGDTHSDVMAELKRLGLPCHTLTLPLLAVRLVGRRRADTIARLRRFETERAVPAARLDELHMVLRSGETAHGSGPIGSS